MRQNFLNIAIFIALFIQSSKCSELNDFKKLNLDMKDIFILYIKAQNVSESCWKAYERTSMFIDMVDASAKIPSGIKAYSITDTGNFDQCMDLIDTNSSETIYGKYCLAYIPFLVPVPFLFSYSLNLGYCTPHQCSGQDLEHIVNGLIPKNITYKLHVEDKLCYTKAEETNLSDGAIATITIIAFFVALVVCSSLYDAYLRYFKKVTPTGILISFSMITNGEKIFKSSNNPDQLLCLNGIRAISMMWVIIGHEYSTVTMSGVKNYKEVANVMMDNKVMFLHNAPYSVDSFFMMGGLVTMYTFLKAQEKGVKFNIILYYIHRYLRLTPSVGILILFHAFLLNYMGNGPFWGAVDPFFSEQCRENWWSALLYIANYEDHSCISQGWYLSVDMQLFILSPLVLLPCVWYPKYRRYLLGCLTIIGCIIPTVISNEYNLSSNFFEKNPKAGSAMDYNHYYYSKTHCRFAPYIIGFLVGDIIYHFKKSKQTFLTKKLAYVFWIIGFGILWLCLYGTAPLKASKDFYPLPHAFINGFGRSVWSTGLGIVIYLCVTGYGGPVDTFLSAPIFQFLGKLSFAMYVLHAEFIGPRWLAARDPFFVSHLSIMYTFWADFMVVLFMSFLFSLIFESPIMILEKYLLGGAVKTKPEKKVDDIADNNNIESLEPKIDNKVNV